jgi:hypothetical protein
MSGASLNKEGIDIGSKHGVRQGPFAFLVVVEDPEGGSRLHRQQTDHMVNELS